MNFGGQVNIWVIGVHMLCGQHPFGVVILYHHMILHKDQKYVYSASKKFLYKTHTNSLTANFHVILITV